MIMKLLVVFSLILATVSGVSAATFGKDASEGRKDEVVKLTVDAHKGVRVPPTGMRGSGALLIAQGGLFELFLSKDDCHDSDAKVCGDPCDTACLEIGEDDTNGRGPEVEDCRELANELRQIDGDCFSVSPDTKYLTKHYKTCTTTFYSLSPGTTLAYCYSEWVKLIDDWLPSHCDADHHIGGTCLARDERWFVVVKRSGST